MQYTSTRGGMQPQSFCDILLEGLAPDGGLYLPTSYPQVDGATLARWRGLSYADLAVEWEERVWDSNGTHNRVVRMPSVCYDVGRAPILGDCPYCGCPVFTQPIDSR